MSSRGRRQLLAGTGLVGLALVTGCLPQAPAYRPAAARRIARLSPAVSPSIDAMTSAFRAGLHDLGYAEGRDLIIEERYVDGNAQLGPAATEVARLGAEVIAVNAAGEAITVHAAAPEIPVVSFGIGDLPSTGLIASLARPGGTVTGLTTPFLSGKQLELLRAAVPALGRAAVLFDRTAPAFFREPYRAVEAELGLELRFVGAQNPEDLEPAFDLMARERVDGVLLLAHPVVSNNQARIAELAIRHRLPSMWQPTDAAARGALMAYGIDRADSARRAAVFVDKILKGAKPADLPVEQPTKFDFPINLRTAQALGITIPPTILQQATEVIR